MAAIALKLPDCSKTAIEEVIKTEKIHDYKLTVTSGTTVGNNYMGDIYRVVITGKKESGEKTSVSLIVKSAPLNPELKQFIPLDKLYAREVFMYDKILPIINSYQDVLLDDDKFGVAKFYLSRCDKLCDLLILEDLAVKGFQIYDRFKTLDYDHIELTVKNLATIHAASIQLKIKQPEMFDKVWDYSAKYYEYGDTLAVFYEKYRPALLSLIKGQEYEEKITDLFNSLETNFKILIDNAKCEPHNVMCHGDCWTGNLLFKYDNGKVVQMNLLDWQGMRISSPVIDLSYFMFTSVDQKFRSKYFYKVLNIYYETLKKQTSKLGIDLSKYYPVSTYKNHQKLYMKYGVMMAMFILPMTLNNVEDAFDVGDILKNEDQGGIGSFVFSKNCSERLTGVFLDAFEYNIL